MKKYQPTSYATASLELIRQGYSADDVHSVLVHALMKAHKITDLRHIIDAMKEQISFGDGEHVLVTTAHEIQDKQKKDIQAKLARVFSESLSCTWKVDSQLVGGIVIRHGDDVINFSIVSLLEQLHTHLEK